MNNIRFKIKISPMKINSELSKTLLELAAKTTLGKITSIATDSIHNSSKDSPSGARPAADPEHMDERSVERPKGAADSPSQELIGQILNGIGTQVVAVVSDGLSKQLDNKAAEIVRMAELALERQRAAALSQMQAVLGAERTKAVEELRKTAASLSQRFVVSAAFIGGSLLMIAAALVLYK
jgi:hypothetical protein